MGWEIRAKAVRAHQAQNARGAEVAGVGGFRRDWWCEVQDPRFWIMHTHYHT